MCVYTRLLFVYLNAASTSEVLREAPGTLRHPPSLPPSRTAQALCAAPGLHGAAVAQHLALLHPHRHCAARVAFPAGGADCSSCTRLADISALACSRLDRLSLHGCCGVRDATPLAACTALALLDSPEQLAVGGGGDVVGARKGGERPCGAVGSALWQMLRIGSAPFLMAG